MKKSLHSVLAIILSLSIVLGGMTMTLTTASAAVSDSEAALSLTAAKEGMVLLKNDNQCLPLAASNRTVALFGGAGAMRTGTTGTGAEGTLPGYTVSIYDGLKSAGFTFTSESWLQAYDEEYAAGLSQWQDTPWDHFRLTEPAIDDAALTAAAQGTDTAIYVIRRISGEGSDRKVAKDDFLLSDNELANLTAIANTFDEVILLLNTCGQIDMSAIEAISNIDAILYVSLPGMEAGNAVASILTGQANPCGKLAAAWAKSYNDYPSATSFMNSSKQVLSEDIYVGYRWFETFDPAGNTVAYPFGYGLSYTTFSLNPIQYAQTEQEITLSVTVTNTGSYAGKEVVQIYNGAPQGMLGKSAVSLIAYDKTDLLAPGASQTLTISFDIADMASYDDEGLTGNPSCYVLEAGAYPIYVGTSSANARDTVAGTYVQESLRVTQQLTRCVAPVESFKKTVNTDSGKSTATVTAQQSTADNFPSDAGLEKMVNTTGSTISFSQLLEDPTLINDYVGQFTSKTLSNFVRLAGGHGSGVAGGSTLQIGAPKMSVADGVTGLKYDYTKSASYPCPTCLAQSFDDDLVEEVAAAVADQFITYEFDTVLAPGVNIQESPLCGRNFGYFSEDPLLSGNMGAAYVRGVQSKGIGATPKHFAANNKETNRSTINSVASERALREIYLKSFQITVEEGEPWAIMTSYNLVNGVETAERSDLLNGILRGEWGFNGVVMTDWGNNSSEIAEKMAGCDLNAFGASASSNIIYNAVANDEMSKTALQVAAKNIILWIMKSYQNYRNGIYAGIQTVYSDKLSKIEAEAFNTKSGNAGDVGFETCGDVNGGINPTNTNQGKVLYYALNVELAGIYRFVPRVAAMSTDGSLSLELAGNTIGQTPAFTVTGDWQAYEDQGYVDIVLPSGSCELAVVCNGSGYNLNYYTLEPLNLANTVTVVQRCDDISADYNTPANQLELPETVTLTLSDGSQTDAGVNWNVDEYNPLRDGAQTISGTVILPENVYNPGQLKAYVTLQIGENPNPVTGVQITNAPTSLRQGESYTFTAAVTGQGEFIQDVDWSVDSQYSSISKEGVLTVSDSEIAQTLSVTAASVTDPAIKHTVSFSVTKNKRTISATASTRLFGIDYDRGSRPYGTEDCADDTGGKNITDFNGTNWVEFDCVVQSAGIYSVVFRYASPLDQVSTVQFYMDNALLAESKKLAYTGGWQDWASTEASTVRLTTGEHVIRLQANGFDFNINYVELTPINVDPPPTYTVKGTVTGAQDPTQLRVSITDGSLTLQTAPNAKGEFTFNKMNAGTYTITVSGEAISEVTQQITLPDDAVFTVTVTEINPPPVDDVVYGDVDQNGEVDAKDALLVLQFAVGKTDLSAPQQAAANVSNEDKIDAVDALLILQRAVGKISLFPVEQ